ncbi:MAG TPA: hypothetical protein VEB86_02955 [Chryseosolibacter sp.]|nr:hypothetical protein [Chryseosolibacter sp.]
MKYFTFGAGLLFVIFALSSCSKDKAGSHANDYADTTKETYEPDTVGLRISALLYYERDMYQEAYEAYGLLLKHDSLDGQSYYRRGYSLMQLNRHGASIPDFLKAAELGYEACSAYHSLALIYAFILPNDSLAFEYCQRCLQIDRNDKDVNLLLKQLNRRRPKDQGTKTKDATV